MFKALLTTDFFKQVAQDANIIIKEDREQYYPIFSLVKETLTTSKNNTIFSDFELIVKKNKQHDTMQTTLTLYTMYPRKIATELANVIHKKFGKFTQMRAVIPNEEYSVMYNMRGLINIYRIDRYKEIPIKTLFDATEINSVLYFPPQLELIDIYHKLYLPNYIDDYDDLKNTENALFTTVFKKIGGGKSPQSYCNTCKVKRQMSVSQIKQLLISFFHNENYVFVGDWAHSFILDDQAPDTNAVMQVISENTIDQDYKNIAMFLSKFTKYGVFYKKKKLYIPKDHRICKHTLYIKIPTFGKNSQGIDKPFMDIYTCGSYELIPFIPVMINKHNLKVGNLYVQLRFLFIDMWLLHFIKLLDNMSEKSQTVNPEIRLRHTYVVKTINKLKSQKTINKLKSQNYVDFIGINYDEKVAQKIEISQKQLKKDSYYPELVMKSDKKYHAIATTS